MRLELHVHPTHSGHARIDPPQAETGDAFTRAVQRVKAEFLEMPGLTLTLAQATRLWAFDPAFCSAVLGALVEARFLVRTRHAAFVRAD